MAREGGYAGRSALPHARAAVSLLGDPVTGIPEGFPAPSLPLRLASTFPPVGSRPSVSRSLPLRQPLYQCGLAESREFRRVRADTLSGAGRRVAVSGVCAWASRTEDPRARSAEVEDVPGDPPRPAPNAPRALPLPPTPNETAKSVSRWRRAVREKGRVSRPGSRRPLRGGAPLSSERESV